MPSDRSSSTSRGPSDTVRSVISLALCLHLIILLVVLSSAYLRSPLQARLLTVMRPYTQLLNFDLSFVPYQLTHATAADVDHRIEVLPQGAEASESDAWHVLPDRGFRGGERYKRYQRLGHLMAFLAEQDAAGNGLSMIARSVSENFVKQRETPIRQIRCRRHMLQSWDAVQGGTVAQRNPDDPSYFRVLYAANTLIADDGDVSLLKIDDADEVARPDAPAPGGTP